MIASLLENRGIPSVAISLLAEVTAKVGPPRTLLVPFPLGFPLGQPHNPTLQKHIIREALSMLYQAINAPLVKEIEFPSEVLAGPQPGKQVSD